MANTLKIGEKTKPVRRVWIPKTNSDELRPLGIPTMRCRALQSLVKAALEPAWEARFEPNSYGFRPGRSCHDAIEAIHTAINHKPKYALDADIAKCFDRICHDELLKKINTSPSLRRQLKAWLKAGVIDHGELFPTQEGTLQGGTISPLLANIALSGLETLIVSKFPRNNRKGLSSPNVVVYADDFVVLHKDLEVIKQCQALAAEYLKGMGLELKPSKTRITHTLVIPGGKPGFDFLGFHIRQYPAGKTKSGRDCRGRPPGFKTLIRPSQAAIKRHTQKLKETVDNHKHSDQETLINALNPMIIGWTNYYSTVASSRIFSKIR
jgi:Retron-type reverse transcriptase